MNNMFRVENEKIKTKLMKVKNLAECERCVIDYVVVE